MRRLLIAGLIAAVVTVGAAVASASDPPASLDKFVCRHAFDPGSREIAVEGVMGYVAGTQRMAMRFQLLQKTSGGPWTQISSGDLGKWKYAPKGLGSQPKDKWSVDKPVYNLPAPATYRFQVSFRWIAHRQVLARQTLMSHTCFQPELRPDLFVKSINREPVRHQGSDAYVAVIRNRGATAAGSFDVRFSDGSVTKDRAVPGLPSHRQIQVRFVGPSCPPNSVTVTADANDQVDDYNRGNNSLTLSCH